MRFSFSSAGNFIQQCVHHLKVCTLLLTGRENFRLLFLAVFFQRLHAHLAFVQPVCRLCQVDVYGDDFIILLADDQIGLAVKQLRYSPGSHSGAGYPVPQSGAAAPHHMGQAGKLGFYTGFFLDTLCKSRIRIIRDQL